MTSLIKITEQEYAKRRLTVLEKIKPNSVVVILANREVVRSNDTHYPFRQDSHFYYLTGFNEPESALVMIKEQDTNQQVILFNRKKDPHAEQWEGLRLGQAAAVQTMEIDNAHPIEEFKTKLTSLLENKENVYYCLGRQSLLDDDILFAIKTLHKNVRKGLHSPEALLDLEPILNEMRLIKSDNEIDLMRHVCELSAKAHCNAMQRVKDYQHEFQLEAGLMHDFIYHGCSGGAYTPIVASGQNACILHYTNNDAPLKQGDLVLIDAGGEYQNYAADITRTFPVNGQFSENQALIYNLVLEAQLAGIEFIKPGANWAEIQKIMIRIMTEGLCELGLLKGETDGLIHAKAYFPFYMHNSGHWLGLDVHDVGRYKVDNNWRELKPGMILTVEPGIYISPQLDVDDQWKGIAVRIEDDVLVTKDGYEVLTDKAPKTIDEIEKIMA